MKKVIIIGCPGSGKSTFARKLEAITGLPLHHLDLMYWNADKTTVEKEVFISRLHNVVSHPEWIIDGNYASSMELRIKEADTVFFLDYPVDVCLKGVEERKGKPRADMPWVESGEADEEFISFIKNFNDESKMQIEKLLEKYSSRNIIVFYDRIEADSYLEMLQKEKAF